MLKNYFMTTTYAPRDATGSVGMDMVLDNLGMDDTLDDINNPDLDLEGDDGNDGDLDLDDRLSQPPEPDQRQRRQQEPDQRRQQREQQRQPDNRRQQQQPEPQRLVPSNQINTDTKGNLVGPDGKVIAKAGFEARMYQDLSRARGEVAQVQHRLTDAESRVQRAVDIGNGLHAENIQLKERIANLSGTKFGLNDNEQVQALQLAQESKTDPAGAIKKMLTMAAARGVDLTKIGIAPGGIDPKTITDLIKQQISEAMTPLQQRTQQENADRERQQQERMTQETATREVIGFFEANPEAKQHAKIFEGVLSQPQFANMSLGEVWARIQLNMIRQQQGGQQQQRQPQQIRTDRRRSLPAGRGVPQGRDDGGMAQPNASYDEILRDVMGALGVQ